MSLFLLESCGAFPLPWELGTHPSLLTPSPRSANTPSRPQSRPIDLLSHRAPGLCRLCSCAQMPFLPSRAGSCSNFRPQLTHHLLGGVRGYGVNLPVFSVTVPSCGRRVSHRSVSPRKVGRCSRALPQTSHGARRQEVNLQ